MNKDSSVNPIKRETMETSAARGFKNASVEGTGRATLVKKKGAQAADPYPQPKPSRSNRLISASERGGAAYGVRVGLTASVAPEAGKTQANGRIFQSAVNRTSVNFQGGAAQ